VPVPAGLWLEFISPLTVSTSSFICTPRMGDPWKLQKTEKHCFQFVKSFPPASMWSGHLTDDVTWFCLSKARNTLHSWKIYIPVVTLFTFFIY
jgi:hypothetical protein